MRKSFIGYYRPSDEEFTKLWEESIFCFDANVLLNLYRYSPDTAESFLNTLGRLGDRIWLPHQVALEYHTNRLGVISEQIEAYDEIMALFRGNLSRFRATFRNHPHIEIEDLESMLRDSIEGAEIILEKAKEEHVDLLGADNLRDRVTELFENKVGEPYSEDEAGKLFQKAEQRFKLLIPPGYKDTSKDIPQKYGDVVLWFQLIDHGKAQKRPLILITDDRKEDWWLQHKGKTIGPRPELINEVFAKAGIQFYMYQSDQFMRYAHTYLRFEEQQAAIKEIGDVRRQDEADQISRALFAADLKSRQSVYRHVRFEWTPDHWEALELYTGPHRTYSVFHLISEAPSTIQEIIKSVPGQSDFIASIVQDLADKGLIYREDEIPFPFCLTERGKQIKKALDEVPQSVRDAAYGQI
jgi:predicted transcriptional regulator